MQPHSHHPMIPCCASYSQNSDVSNPSSYASQRGNIHAPLTLHPKCFLAKLVGKSSMFILRPCWKRLYLYSLHYANQDKFAQLVSPYQRRLKNKESVPVCCTQTFYQLVIVIFGHRGATNSTFVLMCTKKQENEGKNTLTTPLRRPCQARMNLGLCWFGTGLHVVNQYNLIVKVCQPACSFMFNQSMMQTSRMQNTPESRKTKLVT